MKLIWKISAKEGHESVVRTFLEYGINVNIRPRTARKCSALIYAAEEGHLTIVQILLDHGADPNIRDHIYKHSAMVVAVKKKCYGMNSKRNYNPIIAELLWRRIPNDQKTWDDQINSVIEIVKKKKCRDILDMFVNWMFEKR